MNRCRASAVFAASTAFCLALFNCGCQGNGAQGASGGAATTGNLASGSVAVGVVNNLGFYAQAIFSTNNVVYFLHNQADPLPGCLTGSLITSTSSIVSNCNVPPGLQAQTPFESGGTGQTGYQANVNDLYCLLDIAELDLFMTPFQLNLNAPQGMCTYGESFPYSAYMFQPGNVTGEYWATVDSTTTPSTVEGYTCGPVDPTVNAPGKCHAPCPDFCSQATCCFESGVPNGMQSDSAEGATDGGVTCDYDYTLVGGPNCCTGSVTEFITTISSNGITAPIGSTKLFTGLSSACLRGPGVQLNPKDVLGNPVPLILFSGVNGLNFAYTVNSPGNQGLILGANLFSANFWEPSFWNPGPGGVGTATFATTFPPQNISGQYPNGPCMTGTTLQLSGSIDPNCNSTITSGQIHPAGGTSQALPPPLDYTQNGQHYGPVTATSAGPQGLNPYYRFGCLDSANEYAARIQLLVRSFDTLQNWTCGNNPYRLPGFNGTVNPGFDDPLHDFTQWEDFNFTGNDGGLNLDLPQTPAAGVIAAPVGQPFSPYYPSGP